MYSDNKLIVQIVALLKEHNINQVVISSGTRHFPFIHSLENDNFFKLYSVVDERSAAFFALGLIQKTNEPVAIACTSGSAVLNYGSAVSEAYYQRLPLLLITADRSPELLDQMEDQMINQKDVFKCIIKHNVCLPIIKSDTDEWYANRLINEALIELYHHGKGPVKINYPIIEHNKDTFSTVTLPNIRKINLNTSEIDDNKWKEFSKKLENKKIVIIWGQSVNITDNLNDLLSIFCKKYEAVILTDNLSNIHNDYAVRNAFIVLKALSLNEREKVFPDIVLYIGGNTVFNNEIKALLKLFPEKFEHWQVGPEDKIIDPFRRLTEVFEMSEKTFFNKITSIDNNTHEPDKSYRKNWLDISRSIEEPTPPYSQLFAIRELMKSITKNSVLHLANSNTIRMANMFEIDKTILCYCNRGVNGIDGSMSTAVGYASNSDKLNFVIIGDLSFFYDMNAIWNKHLSSNLRILLVNNEGGSVIHSPFNINIRSILPNYTSAGHNTSPKGWVESRGFKYISANNENDVKKGISILTSKEENGPIILEVFTDKDKDVDVFLKYQQEINRITFSERLERKTKAIINKFLK
jgi:2-succinyl-5-enolpyruvyl-6-hydroxy-3-cyclohexene-1-carboxylate synthase